MVSPTTSNLPYGPTIDTRFDWYQATGGAVPEGGRPWILVTPVEGFRGGGKDVVKIPGRNFYEFIKFFIDDRVLNGLATPFDIFVADGGYHLPSTEGPTLTARKQLCLHAPESFYQYQRCFQHIRTIIRDEPTRFPNLSADRGGYAGFSSGGSAALVSAFTEPRSLHSRAYGGPYAHQYRRAESSRPAFMVNWSGGTDYRVGAQVQNNNINIFAGVDADGWTRSYNEDILNAISAITLVSSKSPPTISIYDDFPGPGSVRPISLPHDQLQAVELQAAFDAVGVYHEWHTKSIAGGFSDSLDPNIDIPKIYDFIVGPNALNLE